MSILLGRSQVDVLSLRLLASLFRQKTVSKTPGQNTPSSNSPPNAPHQTYSRDSDIQLKRLSNPFDILYSPERRSQLYTPMKYKSPTYLEIEKNLREQQLMGALPANHVDGMRASLSPAAVTVLPETRATMGQARLTGVARRTLRRRRGGKGKASEKHRNDSSSVFSCETGRSRRSKMSRVSQLGLLRARILPVPVPRKRSFRYSASKFFPAFTSQKELDRHFADQNVLLLMKDMLPSTMVVYRFMRLWRRNPLLRGTKTAFTIGRDSSITAVPTHPELLLFRGAQVVHAHPKDILLQEEQQNQNLHVSSKRQNFMDIVHRKYREQVFAGKFKIPPRLEQCMPFEADIMAPEERQKIDIQMLFEVLMRQTVAAKIEFRLRKSGYRFMSTSSSPTPSPSTSKLLGLQSARNAGEQADHHKPLPPPLDSSSSDSVDTDKIMKRNASLISEKLPSPQISFKSTIHERRKWPSPERRLFSAPQAALAALLAPENTAPPNMTGTFQNFRNSRTAGPVPTSSTPALPRRFSFSSATSSLSNPSNPPDPSEMFVNDFNLIYQQRAENREGLGKTLSNLNLFSLQPLNRSKATLSSNLSSESPVTQGGPDTQEVEVSSYNTSASRTRHSVGSTANTSILHSLDSLTNEVGGYLREQMEATVSAELIEGTPHTHVEQHLNGRDAQNVDVIDLSPATTGLRYSKTSESPSDREWERASWNKSSPRSAHFLDISNVAKIELAVHVPRDIVSMEGSVHGGYTATSVSAHSHTLSTMSRLSVSTRSAGGLVRDQLEQRESSADSNAV